MSKDLIHEFSSLPRCYQIAVFAAVTPAIPLLMLWTMCGRVYEGIASGFRFTWIEWRGMFSQYREMWDAIEERER